MRSSGPAIDARDFLGVEVRWQDDLEHFDVFAMSDLAMTNLRGLMHARPRFEPNAALTFIFELDPAFEHIDQLEGGVVNVRLT